MIIPNDLYPTWSNRDMLDANTYAEQRFKLWLANKCVALWPQIFSWMVVNIYPAHAKWDYRFASDFADKAILVTFEWDSTGRGCNNSACYRTYPKGRMCTYRDPPIIFPSGENTDVVACQPACYIKRRWQELRRRLPVDKSLIDQDDPRRCVECDYLDAKIATHTRVRQLDGRYELYNTQTKSRRLEALDSADIGTPVHLNAEQNIQTDTEMPFLVWDAQLRHCIIPNEFAYQQVVEPWWRDPSHSVCRVTNFRHGNDPVWGYRPKHVGQHDPKDFSFLVRNSRTYCRAFAKNSNDKDGTCKEPLWSTILNYTIAGDALQRWVRRIVDGDWGCADDKWVPIDGERTRESDPSISTSANHYMTWRSDINVSGFKLPPPNILLSDLGIDVRITGNRLYWNSHEGIVSQLPLFNIVESYSDNTLAAQPIQHQNKVSKRHATDNTHYHNYNPLFYKKTLQLIPDKQNNISKNNSEEYQNKNDIDNAFLTLTQSLRQKRHILETRMQENPEAKSVLRADDRDKKLDKSISEQLQALRHKLSKRAITRDENAKNEPPDHFLDSYTASIGYTKSLPEYIAEQYLKCYLHDDKKPSPDPVNNTNREKPTKNSAQRPPRSAPTTKVHTITPATLKNKAELNDLIKHINATENRNKFWAIMQELGIGISAGMGEILVQKSLSYGYKKTLQFIARKSGSIISQSLLKAGLRIAQARIAGIVVSRLTTRILVAIGAISSGIGMAIGAIQVISLLFDIAGLAGWDPGNYNSETDLTVYRDIADFFNYTKESMGRGPYLPLEMMLMLNTVDQSPENSERLDENGTANVSESALLSSLRQTSTTETLSGEDNENTQMSPEENTSLNINERVSVPKWFNRHWPQCFSKQTDKNHLVIDDEQQPWLLGVLFDYLGALTTNSYGQRLVDDPIKIRLNDDDMASLFIEADYRNLTTRSAKSNVDNSDFNNRVASSTKIAQLLLPVSLASVGFGLLFSLYYNQSHGARLALVLITAILLLSLVTFILYFSFTLLPVTRKQINNSSSPLSDTENTTLTDSSPSTTTQNNTLNSFTDSLRAIAKSVDG